jgi:glycosyltransferase involved in cell wall biosynthesis
MNALRILLISSVLPRDTTGGELVLYRHFSQFPGLSLAIATNDCQGLLTADIIKIRANRFLTRLARTRFAKWFHDVFQCFNTFHDTKAIRSYLKNNKPDIILTVAHNEFCWIAQNIAQEFNIPLVTFFHDWWPDMAYIHDFARGFLTKRFKRLYQQSQLVFCVDEEIRQALGTHPNAQILYPISNPSVKAEVSATLVKQDSFTVIYAGTLSGIYGPMMQDLCALVQNSPELSLKLFGPPLDWPEVLVEKVKSAQIYRGFIPNLMQELRNANALLVAMSFNPRDQMRMQTSFPSKIVDYCQFGKPIIIWGPDYSSAVHWGRKYQSALVVTSPLAQDLVKGIQELATQPQEQKRLGNRALDMAREMFNPEKIQQQFVHSLYQLVKLQKL